MELRPPERPHEAHDDEPGARGKAIEIVTAVVLSAAGLLTSWSGYQAALWDGRQDAHYNRANSLHTKASTAELEAAARRAVDVNLFSAWLTAVGSGNTRLADFYSKRFPPELRSAFDTWLATQPLKNPDAPPSPFHNQAVRPPGEERAAELEAAAEREFESGLRAKRTSDDFARATVFFAITLFFGGIAQVFRFRGARLGLLAVAVAACAIAMSRLVGLPFLRPD